MRVTLVAAVTVMLAGCGGDGANADTMLNDEALEASANEIPASLAPFGDGFPDAGDPCRKLGESEATANWLDDSAQLVGCPTLEDAQALGGEIVDTIEGVTLVSVPIDRAAEQSAYMAGEDALVAGTDYHATGTFPCGTDGALAASCKMGVKRGWGEDGTTLVEVTKPDGRTRALFFDKDGKAYGADSAQADRSAAYEFTASREDDWTVIEFGPERYKVPDMLVLGG